MDTRAHRQPPLATVAPRRLPGARRADRLPHSGLAAVLYAGPDAVTSHQTAAFLIGLTDQEPGDVHLLIPPGRRVRPQPGLIVHRATTSALAQTWQRPPRTSVEATVLDLVGVARRDVDVVALVTRAFAEKLTHPARLAGLAATRPRLRWRTLLAEILHDGAGIESPLEWRYRRDVERRHGLPAPRRQVVLREGGVTVRRGGYCEAERVVIELDGRLRHAGVGAFRDAARDNAAAVRGDVTLRYGWLDVVGNRCIVAGQVAAVLIARGWQGRPKPCGPGCPVGR